MQHMLLMVSSRVPVDETAVEPARTPIRKPGSRNWMICTWQATARALKQAVEATMECATGAHVTLAVGYGGRQEVLDAIRALLYEQADAGGTLTELAETLTTDDIARHLYTAGHPDPDLVIRTSGEQRVSGFLPWQIVHSELYFCDAYWPAFREIDFLRALRSYAARQNRRGA